MGRDQGGNHDNRALHWAFETTLQRGEVLAEITSADFGSGRRGYSIVVARQMDGRVSKFLRPQDMADLAAIIPEIGAFIANAKQR